MGERVSVVDYLVLDDGEPYLVATACRGCGATYFERHNACGRCFGTSFERRRMESTGTVRSYTIVHRAAPGVAVPYVAAIIELDGGGVVKANIRDVEPEPAQVGLGMPVAMTTFVAGTDDEGTEAVAFGYSPAVAAAGKRTDA
ncbi:MAG TPA: OB-fold domain-containing protein [Acidimicrobiales bacterium]